MDDEERPRFHTAAVFLRKVRRNCLSLRLIAFRRRCRNRGLIARMARSSTLQNNVGRRAYLPAQAATRPMPFGNPNLAASWVLNHPSAHRLGASRVCQRARARLRRQRAVGLLLGDMARVPIRPVRVRSAKVILVLAVRCRCAPKCTGQIVNRSEARDFGVDAAFEP